MRTATALFFYAIMALSLAGCDAVVKFLLVETHTVESGSFRGLQIGSSKADALRQAKALGAHTVKPIPTVDFQITGANIKEIDKIKQAEGIRIMDYRGTAVDLKFESGVVTRIRRSVPAQSNPWFHEHQKLDDVIKEIHTRMTERPGLVVFPIVFYEGNGWVGVTGSLEEPLRALRPYDAWTFGVSSDKPGGSHFDLYFNGNRLVRIEYRRPRLRLD